MSRWIKVLRVQWRSVWAPKDESRQRRTFGGRSARSCVRLSATTVAAMALKKCIQSVRTPPAVGAPLRDDIAQSTLKAPGALR